MHEDLALFKEQKKELKKIRSSSLINWKRVSRLGLPLLGALIIIGGFKEQPFKGTITNPKSTTTINVGEWKHYSDPKANTVPSEEKYRNIKVLSSWKEDIGSRKTTEVSHYESKQVPIYENKECQTVTIKRKEGAKKVKKCTTKKVEAGFKTEQVPVYKKEPIYGTFYSVEGEKLYPLSPLTNTSYEWGKLAPVPDLSKYQPTDKYKISAPKNECYIDIPEVYLDNINISCDSFLTLNKDDKIEGKRSKWRGVTSIFISK